MANKKDFHSIVLNDCVYNNAMAQCTEKNTWQVVNMLIECMTNRQKENFLVKLNIAINEGKFD